MNANVDYKAIGQENKTEAPHPEKGSIALTPEQVGELEDYINDLHMNNGSLAGFGELLQGYDGSKKIDFYCVGILVGHYTDIIANSLGIIEEFVSANKEKAR